MSHPTLLIASLVLSLALTAMSAAQTTEPTTSSTSTQPTTDAARQPRRVTLIVVGDSTTTPDSGWGMGFAKHTFHSVDVKQMGRNGRSSKSYIDEGWWDQVIEMHGDYVLIQFGHNDQPGKGPDRETDPATTFRDNLRRFVDEVRAYGGTPVLVTSIERRKYNDDGTVRPSLSAYAEATRAVAAAANVGVIDLNTLTLDRYAADGEQKWADLYSPRNQDGSVDTTHLNTDGGFVIGRMVAEQLAVVQPELRSHLMISGPAMPRAEPEAETRTIRVDPTGAGEYPTLQQAIDSVRSGNRQPTIIQLAPGVYEERVAIPRDKPLITLVGEDPQTTIITWHWNASAIGPDGYMVGTGGAYTVEVNADDFTAENITFRNTAGRTGQALALSARGDRHVYRNCRMLGYQDTLYVNGGRQYFVDCYVEGAVDFIFGGAVAVFDRCTIHSVAGGYIAAPSTPQDQAFGLMFYDCNLTGAQGRSALARPWRAYGMAAFIRCVMGEHIAPAGWDNWRNPENEKTARFYEFGSTGPGAADGARVPWARQLSAKEAEALAITAVLQGSDGWDPTAQKPTSGAQ